MDQKDHVLQQDRPIEDEVSDKLGRGPFVDSLVRTLVVNELDADGTVVRGHSTGYVVGLTGQWGLGKSSVLNLLNQKLDSMDHVAVAYFNPWLFSGRDELVRGFFNALRLSMGRSKLEKVRALVEFLDRYWGAINLAGYVLASAADHYGASGVATAKLIVWGSRIRGAFVKPKSRTPEEERASLEQKIAEANIAIVVLIDELDRIEDDEVRAVAQLVKAVGDIKGISYLVAYDPDRVVQALGRGVDEERRRSGELYLEKIIQHPIPLRPLFEDDIKALLNTAFADCQLESLEPSDSRQTEVLNHIIQSIKTPREVKRLVGAFSVIERAVRGEICSYDLLAYCWILTKSPAVRDQIAKHIDELVIDPNINSQIYRMTREMNKEHIPDVVEILGASSESQRTTLDLLFLMARNNMHIDSFGRVLKRRNLVRLLYLGNPPWMMRRIDIESLWCEPSIDKLMMKLREAKSSGKLSTILDTVDGLMPVLPERGDRPFWVALSSILYREHMESPEILRAFADEAVITLSRFGQRNRLQLPRLERLVEALVANQDLIFVPALLRNNLFAHGLTTHRQTARGDAVLSREETESLLKREVPRYRAAVLDGTTLWKLPNTELIYVLGNSGNWDGELREALSGQITSRDAIIAFADLFIPPSFAVGPGELNSLIDISALRKNIETLFVNDDKNTSHSIKMSVQQLKDTVEQYYATVKSQIPS